MTVHNVSPHDGGVESSYTIDWEHPLDIAVDITVFDPPGAWSGTTSGDRTSRLRRRARATPRGEGRPRTRRPSATRIPGGRADTRQGCHESGSEHQRGIRAVRERQASTLRLLFAVNGGAFAIAKLLAGEVRGRSWCWAV